MGEEIHSNGKLALREACKYSNFSNRLSYNQILDEDYTDFKYDYKTVDLLIMDGADIHIYKEEPLYNAVNYGAVPTISGLLRHGADPNARNGEILQLAARKHTYIAQMLIYYGADISVLTEQEILDLYAAEMEIII
jgi:ankyrin repeat protein